MLPFRFPATVRLARWRPRVALAILMALGLGGCLAPLPGPRQLEARRPPMPMAGARAPEVLRRPEPEVRAGAVALVLAGELSAALRACDGVEEGEARQRLRVEVARAVSAVEPRRGAEFSLRLAPGPTQAAAIEVVVDAWWRRAPGAVEAWVVELAPGPARDAARRSLAAAAVRARRLRGWTPCGVGRLAKRGTRCWPSGWLPG